MPEKLIEKITQMKYKQIYYHIMIQNLLFLNMETKMKVLNLKIEDMKKMVKTMTEQIHIIRQQQKETNKLMVLMAL